MLTLLVAAVALAQIHVLAGGRREAHAAARARAARRRGGVRLPAVRAVVLSLKDPAQISAVSLGLPDTIETANYTRAWEEATLGAALLNSTLITVASLLALVLCGSLAAYPLARARRRASHRLYLLFLLGITLPAQLAMVPLYRLVADAGLLGSYTGIVIVYTGMQLPLTVFLYAGFLRAQPREYEEAALIDGATHLQTFARITFPLLRPVTAVVLVINAVFIWNDFLTPLLYLGGSAKETVPVVGLRLRRPVRRPVGPDLRRRGAGDAADADRVRRAAAARARRACGAASGAEHGRPAEPQGVGLRLVEPGRDRGRDLGDRSDHAQPAHRQLGVIDQEHGLARLLDHRALELGLERVGVGEHAVGGDALDRQEQPVGEVALDRAHRERADERAREPAQRAADADHLQRRARPP